MADEQAGVKRLVIEKSFTVADLEVQRGEEFKSIYANNASFGITFFDFTITFGEIRAQSGTMNIEEKVAVTMSIEHTQALLTTLQQQLSAYEKKHGPIRKVPEAASP